MKTQVMSIKEFMSYEKESFSVKVDRHLKRYGKVYKVAGLAAIILSTGNIAFAVDPSIPASSMGFEPSARQLYRQLVGIGKWIIIFKGGFDTIKNIGAGDFDGAKKNFFAYLLTYLLLIALPYGMDQVEKIGISASGQ